MVKLAWCLVTFGLIASSNFSFAESRIKLDILVVIDNSGSMAEEQVNLANKLMPLISEVRGTRWRVGVVTTSPDEPCLSDLIKKSDENPAMKFREAISSAGTAGSGDEYGIFKSVKALQGECLERNWVRRNSKLAILIVSDEDNCSFLGSPGPCSESESGRGEHLLNYLRSIRDVGDDARIYGLINHPDDTCIDALNPSEVYAQVIDTSGGTWGSICDDDYTAALSRISDDIREMVGIK